MQLTEPVGAPPPKLPLFAFISTQVLPSIYSCPFWPASFIQEYFFHTHQVRAKTLPTAIPFVVVKLRTSIGPAVFRLPGPNQAKGAGGMCQLKECEE